MSYYNKNDIIMNDIDVTKEKYISMHDLEQTVFKIIDIRFFVTENYFIYYYLQFEVYFLKF